MINSSSTARPMEGECVSGPLDGVRVLEVASYVFVPAAAAVLADWGADVLKVEHPAGGDPARTTAAWGVPASVNGVSHIFEVANRGKRAIGLDIASAEGKEILLSLVDEADVFLTNLLPAARRKLGIEPEDIMSRNPRVIYGRGTAQGPRGALAGRGGFDGITYWGRSGAAIGATTPGQEFPSPMPGPGFGDMQSGMALAGGISAALYTRERTGRGVLVDCSLMSAGLWAMSMTVSGTSVLDVDELPYQGHEESPNPLTNVYRTKDGHFIALGFLQADKYWPEFCLAVDRLEWIADERFTTMEDRRVNSAACVRLLDELFGERTLADWEGVLSGQDGQWDVFLKGGRVRFDEQVQDNEFAQLVEHEGDGKIVLVPAPAQFDGTVTRVGRAPAPGADTDEVLTVHGFDDESIADLRARGVVG
jgi:crotonobetainyl-CoA:carnitine CoA-transferase CaiB-like acyl-CoA transferase